LKLKSVQLPWDSIADRFYCAYIDPSGYSLIYEELITIELPLTARKRNISMTGCDAVNSYKSECGLCCLTLLCKFVRIFVAGK
jgi:hypothetical protein